MTAVRWKPGVSCLPTYAAWPVATSSANESKESLIRGHVNVTFEL